MHDIKYTETCTHKKVLMHAVFQDLGLLLISCKDDGRWITRLKKSTEGMGGGNRARVQYTYIHTEIQSL